MSRKKTRLQSVTEVPKIRPDAAGIDISPEVIYVAVDPQKDAPAVRHLGNVLAHELTHALEGVPRHSSEGLMKDIWSARDYAGMLHGPLPFAAEDLDLLRAHFKIEMPPAPSLAATR
jgi:hypothetical protein